MKRLTIYKILMWGYVILSIVIFSVVCLHSARIVAFSSCVSKAKLVQLTDATDGMREETIRTVCAKISQRQAIAYAALKDLYDDMVQLFFGIALISMAMIGQDGRVRLKIRTSGRGVHFLHWLLDVAILGAIFVFSGRVFLSRSFALLDAFDLDKDILGLSYNELIELFEALYWRGHTMTIASIGYSLMLIIMCLTALGLPFIRLLQFIRQREIKIQKSVCSDDNATCLSV